MTSIGPDDAERTVVLVAHHDAAHPGLVFHPAIPELADRAGLIENANTSPPLMWPIIGGPAAVAAGSLLGSRLLTKAGAVLSGGFAAAMLDIGLRKVVPGANDNATGVAVLVAMARALAARPAERTRVMLVSTSEEALCTGMEAFGAAPLPRAAGRVHLHPQRRHRRLTPPLCAARGGDAKHAGLPGRARLPSSMGWPQS